MLLGSRDGWAILIGQIGRGASVSLLSTRGGDDFERETRGEAAVAQAGRGVAEARAGGCVHED